MSDTSTLPTVDFSRSGAISAATAVRITADRFPDQPDVTEIIAPEDEGTFTVSILHTSGGRVHVMTNAPARTAIRVHAEMQDVLVGWATLSVEPSAVRPLLAHTEQPLLVHNPAWALYDHPAEGPVTVCVQDFDLPDYEDRWLSTESHATEREAHNALVSLLGDAS